MKVITVIATGATVLVSVQGHGFLMDPPCNWINQNRTNTYSSTIETDVWGKINHSVYGYGPPATVKFFNDMLTEKEGGSLAPFIAKNQKLASNLVDPECGLTAFDDSARSELPASELIYATLPHPGPCEVRCDGTTVLFATDCQASFTGTPAKIPYDKSKCANANRMTIYWVALHGEPWQVYTNCAWLKGGSGRGQDAAVMAAGKSESKKKPTTTAPSSEVAGEASFSDNELFSMDLTEETPSYPTSTSPTHKCSRRM